MLRIRRRSHRWLAWLLFMAYLLRVALTIHGGQLFLPDEARYRRPVVLMQRLQFLGLRDALTDFLTTNDHIGFTVAALVPGATQKVASEWLGVDFYHGIPLRIPALMFSLASVACIGMMYGIIRRAGGGESEALLGALLLALAQTMFYFARHLLPYDVALLPAVAALWVGLRPSMTRRRSALVGLLAGWAFLTYHGYWVIALVALLAHLWWQSDSRKALLLRGLWLTFGFWLTPLILTLGTVALGLPPYIFQLAGFSGTVVQGSFDEGWSLPWEYLWRAEHGMLIAWLVGGGLAIYFFRRSNGRRALLWLGCLVVIYGLFVIGANVLREFVVYGRLVRQMTPFFCLLAAYGFTRWLTTPQRQRILAGALVLIAAPNLAQPFRLYFPGAVEHEAREKYGAFARAATYEGVWALDDNQPDAPYALVNTIHLYPPLAWKDLPPGEVIFRYPHPLGQFEPYLYMGFDPDMRALLRSRPVEIVLVRVAEP